MDWRIGAALHLEPDADLPFSVEYVREDGTRCPLKTDREEVTDADSVGVVVRNQEQEGRLVIFRGGWADLEYWSGQHSDDPVAEAPGAHDPMHLSDIEQLLERFASLFP